MGIRRIERKLLEKRAYQVKSIELKLETYLSSLSDPKKLSDVLKKLIDEFGLIVIEDDEIVNGLKRVLKKNNINPKIFFSGVIFKEDIVKRSILGGAKVNTEKLGLYFYQHAIYSKTENGGIIPLTELLRLAKGISDKIKLKDVTKAIEYLEKKKLIPGRKKLDDTTEIVQFIPFELSEDHRNILSIAKEKGYVTIEEAITKLHWPIERVKAVLENLTKLGIARLDSTYSRGDRYYFPALIKEE